MMNTINTHLDNGTYLSSYIILSKRYLGGFSRILFGNEGRLIHFVNAKSIQMLQKPCGTGAGLAPLRLLHCTYIYIYTGINSCKKSRHIRDIVKIARLNWIKQITWHSEVGTVHPDTVVVVVAKGSSPQYHILKLLELPAAFNSTKMEAGNQNHCGFIRFMAPSGWLAATPHTAVTTIIHSPPGCHSKHSPPWQSLRSFHFLSGKFRHVRTPEIIGS